MNVSSTLQRAYFPTETLVGVLAALALLLVAIGLLPAGQRKRARQGGILLAAALASFAVDAVLPIDTVARRIFVFAATFFLLASIGRSVVLLSIDVVLERHAVRATPRIFRDLSTAAVYLFVALVALRTVDVEPGSILTTSALLTAVVGLAMQDTLGNLVSGLALQLQAPFDVGDWIELDNGQQTGRVTEVTWRATTVMTLDHVEVILPNAGLAKAAIRNYSRPSPVARRRVVLGIAPSAAPHEVHEVLAAAAREAPGVLASPPPFARTRNFAESSIEYELLFFIDDFAMAATIEGAVRDRVYYALARQGIAIPYPTRTILVPEQDGPRRRSDEHARRAAAIASVALMEALPEEARRVLAERSILHAYGPGEIVVRKGDRSNDLYVIERGLVGVEIPRDAGGSAEVTQLGVGQCFGEMSLLTGEPRSASVRAKVLSYLVVIDHAAFHDVLAAHPGVVDRMGALLSARQAELSVVRASGESAPPPEERSRRLISQIREFFKLV